MGCGSCGFGVYPALVTNARLPGLRRPVPNTGAPHPLLCENWIRVYWDQHGSNSRIFGYLDQAKNDFLPTKLTHILCYISSFGSSLLDEYSEILLIVHHLSISFAQRILRRRLREIFCLRPSPSVPQPVGGIIISNEPLKIPGSC